MISVRHERAILFCVLPNGTKISKEFPTVKWIEVPGIRLKVIPLDFKRIETEQADVKTNKAYYFVINDLKNVAQSFSSQLQVNVLNPEAKTVQIKIQDFSPNKAADVVNAIANEFISYDVEQNAAVANKIIEFINSTIFNVESLLSNSEDSLERFKSETKVCNPTSSAGILSGQIIALQEKKFQLDLEFTMYENLKKDVVANKDPGNLILALAGANDEQGITSMLTNLMQLMNEREKILIQTTTKMLNTEL